MIRSIRRQNHKSLLSKALAQVSIGSIPVVIHTIAKGLVLVGLTGLSTTPILMVDISERLPTLLSMVKTLTISSKLRKSKQPQRLYQVVNNSSRSQETQTCLLVRGGSFYNRRPQNTRVHQASANDENAEPARTNYAVPIILPKHIPLPRDRDFMFEPGQLDQLSPCAHIVNADASHIFVRNDTDTPVTLGRKQNLGTLSEYELAGCFPVNPDLDLERLAAKPPRKEQKPRFNLRRMLATAAAFTAAIVAPVLENMHPTGVTVYGDAPTRNLLDSVVNEFPNLWKDTGNVVGIPDTQHMDIPLVNDWEQIYKPGLARVYPVGRRDREVIDQEFDKLHGQRRLEWTSTSTPFSIPCFVVWKDTPSGPKGRVVVDIRALNRIAMPDAYPVLLQSDILALLHGKLFISTVDAASFFYQWWVRSHHRHRLTVASHRGQETFLVPVMEFRNSPAYVQRMIDHILRDFRAFCRAYADDIVIFSASLKEHIQHLRHVFAMLDKHNIHLSPKKSYLGYPSVSLLGQKVDALGLATATDKLAAIARLVFQKRLRSLNATLILPATYAIISHTTQSYRCLFNNERLLCAEQSKALRAPPVKGK